MLKEILIKKSFDIIYDFVLKSLKNTKVKLQSTKEDIEDSLNFHVKSVKNWSYEISFSDLKKSKDISEVFIELDLFVFPRRIRLSTREKINIIPLRKLLAIEKNHIALLGQPGSGKTTSMKHFCQSILFDENFYPDKFDFPVLIKLKDFNKQMKSEELKNGLIINSLFEIFGLKLSYPTDFEKDQLLSLKEMIVSKLLDQLKILLIIDGFDELQFYNRREIVINEIAKLANSLEESRLIITSRTADFHYNLENISLYEISPLNDDQIYQFAHRWLKDSASANNFIKDIKGSPFYDTTIRPLTIAHLCAIYERIGKIPDKPKTVYKKVINLLLEEWDEQKNIKRQSSYSKFEIDRKFEFLSSLAYSLTTSNQNVSFSRQQLEKAFNKIHQDFDLEKREAQKVVNELESHSGLFIQGGYDLYEFAHKSLQEYLTAEYIVKLPSIPDSRAILIRLPYELAIAVTISSSPSNYFIELITQRFIPAKFNFKFYEAFINRLLLEKPDFNFVDEVGLSALILYSLYMSSYIEEQHQLRLFYPDSLLQQFEELIHLIFKRNTKEFVNKHYQISRTVPSETGHTILVLQKINLKNKKLPLEIFCSDTFI